MGKTVHNLHMALEPMMVQFSHACRRRSTLGLLTLRMSCTVYIYQKLIDYDYHRRHSMKCACSSFFVVFFVIWYKTCIPIFRDDVIPWKRFLRCWPFVRESTGHRWIPSQMAGNAGYEVFFDVRVNKRLNKLPSCRWDAHCDVILMISQCCFTVISSHAWSQKTKTSPC